MLIEIPSTTSLAEGSRIHGELLFQSAAQVLGIVEGEILQQSLEPLVLGKSSWIKGSVSSRGPVFVAGRIEGNIFSATEIHLLPTSRVTGTVVAPSLKIEAGSSVQGDIMMRWPNEKVWSQAA